MVLPFCAPVVLWQNELSHAFGGNLDQYSAWSTRESGRHMVSVIMWRGKGRGKDNMEGCLFWKHYPKDMNCYVQNMKYSGIVGDVQTCCEASSCFAQLENAT